ncbi:HrcA family transcriptional regulator [Candidatus Margulisiibacteriota bacterium]
MNKRKNRILKAIVDDFVDSAIPVGSRTIYKEYIRELSPATIRNEMSDLEEEGFIAQPHTSAGRIPTDSGYRYFIDNLMKEKDLSHKDAELIKKIAHQIKEDFDDAFDELSNMFSDMMDYLTIAVSHRKAKRRLSASGVSRLIQQPEFRDVDNTRKIIEILEQRDFLGNLLDEYSKEEAVNVKIGKENKPKEVRDYTIVVTSFNDGEIAIVGPTRMNYQKVTAYLRRLNQELNY